MERLATKHFVDKPFFKQLNNLNFGCDYRNNIENRTFEPIFDKIEVKNYSSSSDKLISSFVNSKFLREKK